MTSRSLLVETNYLPNIQYFGLISNFDNVVLERFEYFEKQTLRNRCSINTSQGVKLLSVPLQGRHGKMLTKDVKVEAGNKWRNIHWRTIESAYRKAPFFEFYADPLKSILFHRHDFLFDLNLQLLSFCLQSLKLTRPLTATMSYDPNPLQPVFDFRNSDLIQKSSILQKTFQPKPYQQVFGNVFASNLSVIDLLFCCGPDSLQIIKSSHQPIE